MPTIKIVPMPGVLVEGPQGPKGLQGDPGPSFSPEGATGTFVSNDNKTITVVSGIIITIQENI